MEITRKPFILFTLFIFILCLLMALIDQSQMTYPLKSLTKWILFFGFPMLYMFKRRRDFQRPNFKPEGRKLFIAFGLGVGVYVLILISFVIFQTVFDFSNIVQSLAGEGIHRDNFLYVALYISFINSLLEEFFFRVFIYYYVKEWVSKPYAMLFSATIFSLYHVAIIDSWFTPFLFIFLIMSLFIAGLLFLWINDWTKSIYSSWIVHIFANFSINTIGFMLFGFI